VATALPVLLLAGVAVAHQVTVTVEAPPPPQVLKVIDKGEAVAPWQ